MRGMTALPMPIDGGKIDELREFLRVDDDQWVLIVAWLVAAFHPEGPYAILILQGEHGSSKSTVTRILRLLIDPSTTPLRAIPRNEENLAITANNSWVIAIDNVSDIPQWFSDALCRLSTGGGLGTRELYTNEEEILFDAKRPIILNGIGNIAKSGDLADRSLIVTIPPLPEAERLDEKSFWEKFEKVRPRIFGALLRAVVTAHQNVDQIHVPNLPRMADFVKWVSAAAPALPFTREDFLAAYRANRSDWVALSLEGSDLASAIQSVATTADWEGSYTQLLKELNEKVGGRIQESKAWPKNARALSSALRKLAPLLRVQGVDIREIKREHGTNRKRVHIRRTAHDSGSTEG
jgi:hypothetical protein